MLLYGLVSFQAFPMTIFIVSVMHIEQCSHNSGSGATESHLEKVKIPGQESQHAHTLTLQIPLVGAVAEGGIKMVLRTARDPVQWLGCTFQGVRHDMFINLRKVSLP